MKYEIEKNAQTQETPFKLEVPILKIDEPKRIVYGRALVPEKIDKQGDVVTREDVERVAHEFMINMQQPFIQDLQGEVRKSEIGFMHKQFGVEGLFVVESYIDPQDGSWILGTKIQNDQIWDKVQKGEIKGYSIGGVAERIPVLIEDE